MEKKKTKLTISGNPKKSFKNFDASKNQAKKTVNIERQINKTVNKSNFSKSFASKSTSIFRFSSESFSSFFLSISSTKDETE